MEEIYTFGVASSPLDVRDHGLVTLQRFKKIVQIMNPVVRRYFVIIRIIPFRYIQPVQLPLHPFYLVVCLGLAIR